MAGLELFGADLFDGGSAEEGGALLLVFGVVDDYFAVDEELAGADDCLRFLRF